MAYGVYSDRGYREHILARNKNTNKTEVFTQEDQTFTGRKTFLSGVTTSDLEVRTVEVSESLKVKGKDITEIIDYLPNDVSKENKLTTKDFVNSSVSTNTANFLGTFNTLEEIQSLTDVTNNDYAFWKTTDTLGNVVFKRYKYSVDEQLWKFEYDLNNSSFTAKQWEAINSGITAELVAKIEQGGGGVPVGTIHHYIGIVAPEGYLMCDKSYNATDYPQLWAVLPDSLKNFDTGTFDIDFRELVMVGAGQNAKQDIKSHDVYELGQFKDDQIQGHHHFLGDRNNTRNTTIGIQDNKGTSLAVAGQQNARGTPLERAIKIISDDNNGQPRIGTTTHGKQIGIKYIIKY